MIKLKRQTEYALISLLHMSRKSAAAQKAVQTSTAREIAERYGLPFEITAKTLQKLKTSTFIRSIQGVQGGYVLAQPLSEIRLNVFLSQLEGEQNVVACCSSELEAQEAKGMSCDYRSACEIRPFMGILNTKMNQFLSKITLDELDRSPEVFHHLDLDVRKEVTQ